MVIMKTSIVTHPVVCSQQWNYGELHKVNECYTIQSFFFFFARGRGMSRSPIQQKILITPSDMHAFICIDQSAWP